MVRNLINDYIKRNVKSDNVALLFSSGMDSLSILLSLLDCSIRPTLYTFYVDGYISEDLKNSRKIASVLGLKMVEICISTDLAQLEKDIRYIITEFDVVKKTQIQCIHPFIHIVNEINEDVVLSGLCADDLYGSSRKMAEIKNNVGLFNSKRITNIENQHASSYIEIKTLFKNNNKTLICPYKECKDLISWFMGLSYDEMNSPKQKNVMYMDYKKFIDENKLYRRNSNLQCNSRIRELHDLLLQTELNTNKNKSVVAIYNKLYKEIKGVN